MAKAGRGADQYMVRFPDGLRDRIKAESEVRGTSINTEIIRVLERAFPAEKKHPKLPVNLTEAQIRQIVEIVGDALEIRLPEEK